MMIKKYAVMENALSNGFTAFDVAVISDEGGESTMTLYSYYTNGKIHFCNDFAGDQPAARKVKSIEQALYLAKIKGFSDHKVPAHSLVEMHFSI